MLIGCSVARSNRVKVITKQGGLGRRLGWFIALWLLGVATVGMIGFSLRWIITSLYGG